MTDSTVKIFKRLRVIQKLPFALTEEQLRKKLATLFEKEDVTSQITDAGNTFIAWYGLGKNNDINIYNINDHVIVLHKDEPYLYPRIRGEFVQFFSIDFTKRIEIPLFERKEEKIYAGVPMICCSRKWTNWKF